MVTWEHPGLHVASSSERVFPTYLHHLFGKDIDGLELQTACATISNRDSERHSVRLTVDLVGYSDLTTTDVSIGPHDTLRKCVNPVFDRAALYALMASTPARIEAYAFDSDGVEVSAEMVEVTVLMRNDVLWMHSSLPATTSSLETMRDLANVLVTPHATEIENLLPFVQERSVWGFFDPQGSFASVIDGELPVGTYFAAPFYHEPGDAPITLRITTTAAVDLWVFEDVEFQKYESSESAVGLSYGSLGSGTISTLGDGDGVAQWIVVENRGTAAVSVRIERTASDADAAVDLLRVIYDELQDGGTTYLNIPQAYFQGAQHIRTGSEVIDSTAANCVDGSLLFASLAELAGVPDLYPTTVYLSGHAFFGLVTPQGYFWPVETTLMGTADFIDALAWGLDEYVDLLSSEDPLFYESDLLDARGRGVFPQP
jgi:hypothetical protein